MTNANLRSQLPNMDALVAFEAAARHNSFARAAQELKVTSSAISQQIKALEETLGAQLFVRGHKSVALTQAGNEFANSVAVALMHISNAATDLRPEKSNQVVTLAADTSIAAYWLMPRLAGLRSAFPDIRFRLHVSDVEKDLVSSDFQLSILHGRGNWQGMQSTLLFAEEVFPVCAPGFLDGLAESPKVETLADAPLLDLEYEKWNWMNWSIWLAELGCSAQGRGREVISNNYGSLIEAAKQGMGFALAWAHLHTQDLENGTLIAPFADSVKTQNGYFLAWPYSDRLSEPFWGVRDWLLANSQSDKLT